MSEIAVRRKDSLTHFTLSSYTRTSCTFLLTKAPRCSFVMSRTEKERGGSGIAHEIKTWIIAVSFHMGNILLCVFPKPLWPLETAPIILVHAVYRVSCSLKHTFTQFLM
jgi:hypothetical protein